MASAEEEGFTVSTTTLAKQIKNLPDEKYILVCDIGGTKLDLSINEKEALSQIYLLIL